MDPNVFRDVLTPAMALVPAQGDKLKLARLMDAAIAFGAIQARTGQGGFPPGIDALTAAYWQKVRG